jgi:ferritin-like metal-binding protein YciE
MIPMNQETLQEFFLEQLRDIYDAEKQLVKALPKLAKAVQSEDLAEAIRTHLGETQTQVSRIEEVFEIVGVAAKGKPCKGMKGLLEEGDEAIKEEEKGTVRDLAIIAGAQRVEHYEIAAYGTARTIAEHLGLDEAADLLQQTEEEEKQADAKLTEVATTLYEFDEGEDEEMDKDEGEETASAGASKPTRSASAPSHSRRSSH